MPERRDLLFEIGTEELPPKSLTGLAAALEQGLLDGLQHHGLAHGPARRFATPRRLAVLVEDLPVSQPDRRTERRGPALTAAFGGGGRPTRAALGFARSCGTSVDALERRTTGRGTWLVHAALTPGRPTAELLPEVLDQALARLPVSRRMRWSSRVEEFVRPVHWLLLLLGPEALPYHRFGVEAGGSTRGHRFHHPSPLPIAEPRDYPEVLRREGHVIADLEARRASIHAQITARAAEVGGTAVAGEGLMDEVTALTEWPVALLGRFDPRFLDIPHEVLITTMQGNQRYFPVRSENGALLPAFVTVANVQSLQPELVVAGNERVIRPRFADAEFFWSSDRRRPLHDRIQDLEAVVFQERLGTLRDRSGRLAALARSLATDLGLDADLAERAGWLSKCDLITDLVQEFPELQGVLGRYFARWDGEDPELAQALEDQYRPRFASDRLPATATGRALAIAERLDLLLGCFALGQVPSGTADPFGLRRAAVGLLRIVIEARLDLDLEVLLQRAAGAFPEATGAAQQVPAALAFVMERLRAHYAEQGFRPDHFDAVLACAPARPLDFDARLRALASFSAHDAAQSLTAANKRIRNLLRRVGGELPSELDAGLLQQPAERVLAARLRELDAKAGPLARSGRYDEALAELAELRGPVDRFFDEVLVMAGDPALRNNRLALLNALSSLFMAVADLSRLQQ